MTAFNTDVPAPTHVYSEKEAWDLLHLLLKKKNLYPDEPFGFDTETTGKKVPLKESSGDPLDWMSDHVILWSLSAQMDRDIKDDWVAYLNKWHPEQFLDGYGNRMEADKYGRWTVPAEYLHMFIGLLEDENTILATWNGKYDAHVCWNSRVNLWNAKLLDLLVAGYLLDENLRGRMSLKDRAEDWCKLPMVKFKDLFASVTLRDGTRPKEFETDLRLLIDEGHAERVSDYASYDAFATLKLYEYLKKNLSEEPMIGCDHFNQWCDGDDSVVMSDMWSYFVNIEAPITKTLWRMERRGLAIDLEQLEILGPKLTEEEERIKTAVNHDVGFPINVNAAGQLSRYFFDPKEERGLKLPPIKMTAGGRSEPKPSVDAEVLEKLAEDGVEVATKILRIRKLVKLRSAYVENLKAMAKYFKDSRIHPSFNQYGARTGRFSTDNPNCFDGQTEILTPGGWENVKNLSLGNQCVAQWVPRTNEIDWVLPTNIIHQPYDGNMVVLLNQHIDLVLTPDHRCPLIGRNGQLYVVPASEYKEDYQQLHAAKYDSETSLDLSRAELQFLVATQADGSWSYNRIDFGFNKARKAERLEHILTEMGAEFRVKKDPSKKVNKFRFTVSGAAVDLAKKWLTEYKQLGPWIVGMNRDQLSLFCKELFYWDGCLKNESMYSSSEKINADWAQIALLLNGQRAKIREYMPPSGKVNYQVDTVKRPYSWTTNIEKTEVKSDGVVHCLTVPSGFVVVRRNGKACISGQSQNFPRPKGDEFGIRKMFIAPPGKKLIVSDYEQLEMRIMAHMSGDKRMIGAINEGMDLHCYTVSVMYNVPYDEVIEAKKAVDSEKKTKIPATERQKLLVDYRQAAKAIGFGLIYGAGPNKIGAELRISKEDAKKKINDYFKTFPGVKEYIDITLANCKRYKYVTTLVGRKRRLPEVNNSNYVERGHAEREAVNVTIQGTAADIVKYAMLSIELDSRLNRMGVQLLNQVHDELVLEVPETVAEAASVSIRNYMEYPFNNQPALCVPTPVDLKIVSNWAEAK